MVVIRWSWTGSTWQLHRSAWERRLVDAALAYAARGWRVLPVRGAGKLPATKHGVLDASADVDVIAGWWTYRPADNIGIACGAASDLIVVDLDVKPDRDGRASLAQLVAEHGPLSRGPVAVRGASMHLYFRHIDGVRNSANLVAPGIDIRTDGGYVVAAPSLHPSGEQYRWLVSPDDCEVPPLPTWFAELCRAATPVKRTRTRPTVATGETEGMEELSGVRTLTERIEALRGRVTVDDVLDEEGLDATPTTCPIHGGDNPTAFVAYDEGHRWHCFTQCGQGGDVVDLIRALADVDIHRAIAIAEALAEREV